ncbi:MAG: ATP-binding protein [Methanoregula sp.]
MSRMYLSSIAETMQSSTIELLFKAFLEKDESLFQEVAQQIIDEEEKKNHRLLSAKLKQILAETPSGKKDLSYQRKSIPPIPRDNEKGFPLLEVKKTYFTWNDLVIPKEILDILQEIPKEHENSVLFSSYGLKPRNKILLCGPPGTGKTLSAKILSSEIGYPLIVVKFESVISSFLGETATNLRKIFDYIEKGKWVVLFDEFDIIGKKRDDPSEHGEIKRVVNNFMLMLENYEGESILVASTNHPQILDSGVWRRFDDVIRFDLPDTHCRRHIFEKKLEVIKKEGRFDLEGFAEDTDGFSGSDIEQTVTRAVKRALLNSRKTVSFDDIMASVQRQKKIIQARNGDVNGRSYLY